MLDCSVEMPGLNRREWFTGLPALLKGVPPRRKNVLLLMTDQRRPHAMGVYGDRLAATPNLAALARECAIAAGQCEREDI